MLPIIPWVGGKYRQAPNITPLFETIKRSCYCEPFGGSAAMLCRKSPEYYEIYNDRNGLLTNLFRVLRRHDAVETFERLASTTPMCRAFYNEMRDICYAHLDGNEQKRDTLIKSAMLDGYDAPVVVAFAFFYCQRTGFGGGVLHSYGGGSKGVKNRNIADAYKNAAERIEQYKKRFDRVNIENIDAFDCIAKYDDESTLFYIDPPYDVETSKEYKSGWDAKTTRKLVDVLSGCKASVVLSCYDSEEYQELVKAGYKARHFKAYCSASQSRQDTERVETVYLRRSKAAHEIYITTLNKTLLFQ